MIGPPAPNPGSDGPVKDTLRVDKFSDASMSKKPTRRLAIPPPLDRYWSENYSLERKIILKRGFLYNL